MSITTGLPLVVAACARGLPLSEVPVVGGTEEQRAEARAELEAFEGWVGDGRVRIVRVEFDTATPGGSYTNWSRIVRLSSTLEAGWVRIFVRHELAHALDYQQSDLSFTLPALQALAEELPTGDDGEGGQREAFARACEIGPFGALVVAAGDCGIDPTVASVGRWLSTTVWRDYPPPEWVDRGVVEATYRDGPTYGYYWMYPTARADRIGLELVGPFDPLQVTLDLHTGAVAEAVPFEPIDTAPPMLTEGWLMVDRRGWPDGPGVGMVLPQFDPVGRLPLRLAWFDGDRWHPVNGCVDGTRVWSLFTAENRVWFAEGDWQNIWWTPIP